MSDSPQKQEIESERDQTVTERDERNERDEKYTGSQRNDEEREGRSREGRNSEGRNREGRDEKATCSLLVRNISYRVSVYELKEICSKYGEVKDVYIPTVS